MEPVEDKDTDISQELNSSVTSSSLSGSYDVVRRDSFGSVVSDGEGEVECRELLEVDCETGLELITLEEVAQHDSREDGWMVIYDKVYNVTKFLTRHPGGEEVLLEYLGHDATMAFRAVGHSRAATKMLDKYLIGILPAEERLNFSS